MGEETCVLQTGAVDSTQRLQANAQADLPAKGSAAHDVLACDAEPDLFFSAIMRRRMAVLLTATYEWQLTDGGIALGGLVTGV